jgi:hypothetical protein
MPQLPDGPIEFIGFGFRKPDLAEDLVQAGAKTFSRLWTGSSRRLHHRLLENIPRFGFEASLITFGARAQALLHAVVELAYDELGHGAGLPDDIILCK